MRPQRVCNSCKQRLDASKFEAPSDVWCRSCGLIGKRLAAKFEEMVADHITGLTELNCYLDKWYSSEASSI